MKSMIYLLLAILYLDPVSAQSLMDECYPIDAGHSYLEFSVQYMGYAQVKGRFEKFGGLIRYDEKDLGKTSVTISAKTGSIDTDGDWRDKDLRSPNWFDSEKYPNITFVSHSIKERADGIEMTGQLTIKDVTKEITIYLDQPSGILKDSRSDLQVIFTGRTEINRTDFGVAGERWSKIKEGITAVAEEVQIELSVLGKKYQEKNLAGFVQNPERPPGELMQAYSTGGIDEVITTFERLNQNKEKNINANALNIVGHYLMVVGKTDDASMLFEKNLLAFPESEVAYLSLAEACFRSGKVAQAKALYEQLLIHDSENTAALEILRHL